MSAKATARAGGKYFVFVNVPEPADHGGSDPHLTDTELAFPAPRKGHTTEREAWETCSQVLGQYPDATVRYEHHYVVDVESDVKTIDPPPPMHPPTSGTDDPPSPQAPGEWPTGDPEAPLPGEDWIEWLQRLDPIDFDEIGITHVASFELAVELWEDRSRTRWRIQRAIYGDPALPDDDPKTARQIGVAWRGFFVKYDRRNFFLNPFTRSES